MSVLWLIWGIVVMIGLGALALQSVSQIDAPTRQVFAGTVSPRTNPVGIDLPRNAVLDEVVVKEGDQVQIGQTLIALDADAMEKKRDLHARDLRVSSFLVACLQDRAVHTDLMSSATTVGERTLLNIAKDTCDEVFERAKTNKKEVTTKKSILTTELELVRRYRKLQIVELENPEPKEIEKVLSLSILETQLQKDLLVLDDQEREITKDLKSERSNLTRRELTKIQSHAREIAQLNTLISEPRIVSPSSGQVSRVRKLYAGESATNSARIIELSATSESAFILSAWVPLEKAKDFAPGQQIEFKVASFSVDKPNEILTGTINAMTGGADSDVEIEVTLSDQATEVLLNTRLGLSLTGSDTAAEISIWTPSDSFGNRLMAHLEMVVPKILKSSFDKFERLLMSLASNFKNRTAPV